MARTDQTSGTPVRKVLYTQTFTDHAGRHALRIGACQEPQDGSSPGPPPDFSQDGRFCFQVYTSIPLELEGQEPPAKRNRSDEVSTTPSLPRFADLKEYLAPDLFEAQCPDVIWEIYTLLDQHVLDFVDHSRHEIAHRKLLRRQGRIDVPLIPKLVLSDDDDRKAAFLFGLDDASGWPQGALSQEDISCPSESGPDSGPLWVHFDGRLSFEVTKTEHALRLEDAIGTMGLPEEDIRVWPEQIDIMVKRIQDADQARFRLPTILSMSCADEGFREEDLNLGMDFGFDTDENAGETSTTIMEPELNTLHSMAATLRNEVQVLRPDDGGIVVSTVEGQNDADLQYVIYVPFLHQPKMADELENTAKAFSAAVDAHLTTAADGRKKTFRFEFYKPSEATDSAVLASFRTLQRESGSVGYLTAMSGDQLLNPDQGHDKSGEKHLRRLHPLNLNPHILKNDPLTCGFKPYETFLIIIDRPDFAVSSEDHTEDAAAVRFLLTDGGRSNEDEHEDYLQTQVWRSVGMDEVIRRLTLMPIPDEE